VGRGKQAVGRTQGRGIGIMDVEIFALCDAATDSGGKLNILGAFDRVSTRQFPAVHPPCALGIVADYQPPTLLKNQNGINNSR